MSELKFPTIGITTGTQYTGDNNITYIYDGVKWVGHATNSTVGTNSITNNGHTVQVDANGNLIIPTGASIIYESGATVVSTSTRWDATPAEEGCPIYAELTPDHFWAYTQKSHLALNNDGTWHIGSNYNANGLYSNDNTATLYSNSGDVIVRTGDSSKYWTFDATGNLTIPVTGDILRNGVSVLGSGQAGVDGGLADQSGAVVAITTVTTENFTSDDTLYVTYNVDLIVSTATQAGVILKGLTNNYTQVAGGGSFNTGTNTSSFEVDSSLWLHMVSIVVYVQDARGYTFYSDPVLFDMPYGSCLVEGTMITMADGSYKAVEDIEYSDFLRVWNFDLGEFSEASPIWIKRSQETHKRNRFTFSDGTVLETVGHHMFNKQAGAFTKFIEDTTPVGTVTVNEYGEEITLISKETITTPTRYYNVWTQYHLNLFANGILTSNRFNNIYPIEGMKFVKDDRDLRPKEEFVGIDNRYVHGLRLQEQPREYTTKYIQHYVHDKLEHQDVANSVMDKELQNDYY